MSTHPTSKANLNKRIRINSIFGNYLNYYTKRSGQNNGSNELDSRLQLIPKDWLENQVILDVGTNSGLISIQVAQSFNPIKVIGVDIDDKLIKLAQKQVELKWSIQKPRESITAAAILVTGPSTRDRPPHELPVPSTSTLASPTTTSDSNYFPVGLARLFGSLPLPPKDLMTRGYEGDVSEIESVELSSRKGKRKATEPLEIHCFPLNVQFRTSDWPRERIPGDSKGYDVIIAFSITKWIHLNHLNAGLLKFFTKAYETLLPGGKFILEPQPFSSYKQSSRLIELKSNFEKLKSGEGNDRGWREEEGDFDRILLGVVGFERKETLMEAGVKGFKRPVYVYHKAEGSSI